MEQHVDVGSVLAVTILAFLVPVLLARIPRIRIPVAVGEILVGLVVGKSGLDLLHMDPILSLLSFLGLASLMFASGLEMDLGLLVGGGALPRERNGRPSWVWRLHHPLALGVIFFGLSLTGAYFFGQAMAARGLVENGLLVALIVSTSGLSLIAPVLKEHGLIRTPFGTVILAAGVIGDFVPMLALAVAVPLFTGGRATEVLLVLALLLAAVATYWLGQKTKRFWYVEELLGGTAQLGVRGAFATMLIFLVLAEFMGVEAVLGTFVAGVMVGLLAGRFREELTHKLDVLGFGFLVPIFFLGVGLQFDLPALLQNPSALLLVPLILGANFLIKSVPGLLLLIWYPARQALGGAILLATQMGVTIAAAAVVFRAGALSAAANQAIVLVAMLTAVLAPVISGRLMPTAEAARRRRVLIAGHGRGTPQLAQRLLRRGWEVMVITPDPEEALRISSLGVTVVQADPATEAGLEQAGAGEAAALVAMTGYDDANLAAARIAKERFGLGRTLALVTGPEALSQAHKEGIEAFSPDTAAVDLLENLLFNPGAAGLITGDGTVMAADAVLTNPAYARIPLRDLRLPPQVLIVSVTRNGEKLIPHGDTVLYQGDRVTYVAPPDDVAAIQQLLARE